MGGASIVAQNSVPGEDIGTATAGSMLTKQLGGATGLACAQSLAATGIGLTVGWIGALGGLLALASVAAMPDLRIVPGISSKNDTQPVRR